MTQPVITSIGNEFAQEEVESIYTYPAGYKGARPIADQVNRLRAIFPDLGSANEKLVEQPLPSNAEGYFAIPRWETIGKLSDLLCLRDELNVRNTRLSPGNSPSLLSYCEAVELVFAKLMRTRRVYNQRELQLGPEYLRQSERSARMWQELAEQQQGHDILVVPAQFGLCHRGQSVRRAREMFGASEFGLGAFATGIMLLTHAERLRNIDDLSVDCAGDEVAERGGGWFAHAPRWSFFNNSLHFESDAVTNYACLYGSASAFLPHAA